MLTVQELLYSRKLPRNAKIKMVRHKDKRIDVAKLYRNDKDTFLEYQSSQENPVFCMVDYIVSFLGENNSRARFLGVYKVFGQQERENVLETKYFQNTKDCILKTRYYYPMKKVDGFEDLEEKIIIDWKTPLAWHQWIDNPMEVVGLSRGLNHYKFSDYLSFVITFNELSEIIINKYDDWFRMLSAVNAVYLIQDSNTGKLYIGSTYGENGIWGRWERYVKTNGHGGNKSLKELIELDNLYAHRHFHFTIIELLSKNISQEEALAKEQLYKKKLGTISYGLNNN